MRRGASRVRWGPRCRAVHWSSGCDDKRRGWMRFCFLWLAVVVDLAEPLPTDGQIRLFFASNGPIVPATLLARARGESRALENPTLQMEPHTHAAKSTASAAPKNSQSKPPAAAQQPQPETIDARAPAPRHAMALPIQARRRRPPSRLALLFAVCKCSDALTLSRRPLRQTRRTQLRMMDEVECDVAIVGGGPAGCCCALVYG